MMTHKTHIPLSLSVFKTPYVQSIKGAQTQVSELIKINDHLGILTIECSDQTTGYATDRLE